MEGPDGVHCDGMKITVKKKRSVTCRRPRPESQVPLTDNLSKISSDDIPAFDTNPRRKEFSLSQCISRAASIAESERVNIDSRLKGNNRNLRSTEGVLAPVSWKNRSREDESVERGLQGNDLINGKRGRGTDFGESEGDLKKLKVKVQGNVSSRKCSRPVNDTTTRSNRNLQNNLDECNSKKALNSEKEGSMTGKRKQGEATGPVRKSRRAPKKRVYDEELSDEDEEIRYLEKLKYKTLSVNNEDNTESGKKQVNTNGETAGKRRTGTDQASEDTEYEEEIESVSDEKEIGNENKRESSSLTTRQRALASASGGSSVIEFPDGLPPAPSRRKRENLSVMEQQVKKAEAAQRRKIQIEKAARESEAEAIRKILGQDSSRKKRGDKIKKRLDELAQEKVAHEELAPTNYIRTIMGPNGTTVSFPSDKVPSLFDPKPSSYPPPRENCAGPLCTNPYKYRDSKTKLPLCSLQCYKAVQVQVQEQVW